MPSFKPLQRKLAVGVPPTSSADRQDFISSPSRHLSRLESAEKKWDKRFPAEDTESFSRDSMSDSSVQWGFGGISLLPLGRPALQTKLTINEPGDAYEQEADRVANQVMRNHQDGGSLSVTPDSTRTLRRACACGGTCSKCKEDEE